MPVRGLGISLLARTLVSRLPGWDERTFRNSDFNVMKLNQKYIPLTCLFRYSIEGIQQVAWQSRGGKVKKIKMGWMEH
jgi:hypothetical protein